ncbi:MAG TPA: hypothetical protein PLN53_07745 [Terricaulis sp.]|nr:hypothetical protein [Terricaulis sp.]
MYYFAKALDNDRTLFIAPLTDRVIARSGQDLEDASGYFLYSSLSSDGFTGVEIIARVASEEAAFALKEMLGM